MVLSVTDLRQGFELGPWRVLPERGLIRDGAEQKRVEPLPMDVLVVLASRQGEVVHKEDLVEAVWHGRPVADEVITRCIAVLRKALGDNARSPTFIENVPKIGYRIKAPVVIPEAPPAEAARPPIRRGYLLPLLAGFGAVAMIALYVLIPPEPTGGPMRAVAVFQFECMTGDGEARYLCFGFSEELVSTIYRIPDLRVVKIKSPLPDGNAQELAERYDVDGLIEGTVLRVGETVRITAQLIDASDGSTAWSATYDGPLKDIFSLQERVASDVGATITGTEREQLTAASRPASFAAFASYAEAQYRMAQRTGESIRAAIDLLRETIRLDPEFGPAYLRLAEAYLLLPDYAGADRDEMYRMAEAVADEGISADPRVREPAGTVYGFIHHKQQRWMESTRAYETAVNAEVVYPISRHWYSRLLASVGRIDESLRQARMAVELDPDDPVAISRMAIANFWSNDLEEAGRYFALYESVRPADIGLQIHDLAAALFLARIGDLDRAAASARTALRKSGLEDGWVEPYMAALGDPDQAEAALAIVEDLSQRRALPGNIELTLWVLLGETDRAMQIARTTLSEPSAFDTELLFIEEFRPLREHPEFPQLLDDLGLTRYWRDMGCRFDGDHASC